MPQTAPHFEDVVRTRMSRRGALKALTVLGGGAAGAMLVSEKVSAFETGELTYDALALNTNDAITTASGFTHDIVISWGDPVSPGAPAFDIDAQTVEAQSQQFGFNNDWTAFYSLKPNGGFGSDQSEQGLLWVNHEYTSAEMMFPDLGDDTTDEQKLIEIEAHGASIIEVSLDVATNSWSYDPGGERNRRITGTTPIKLSGPALGHRLLETDADRSGKNVLGMFNNCGGGATPWGTALTAEENFDQYFGNFDAVAANTSDPDYDLRIQDNDSFTYSDGDSRRRWEAVVPRFDMGFEPNEVFRFGWIVEVNPYNPNYKPRKRTALGRFKHEAAAGTVGSTGQYVVYMGDDASDEHIYKFVSDGRVNSNDRQANFGLLDYGTLYCARFDADGTGVWLPLTFGTGPLTADNGWEDQAHVLLFARNAAKQLGATPMDRPEDVDVSPTNGYIYAAMTGTDRDVADAANPRTSEFPNPNSPASDEDDYNGSGEGHIIEIREDGDDASSTTLTWEIFMLCGAPGVAGTLDAATPGGANSSGRTYYGGFDESQVSPVARPDNLAFDSLGNVWISTDGMPGSETTGNNHDTVFGVPTAGSERGHCKALASGPVDCEMTGPYFTPDDTSLFIAVQHPGGGGTIAEPTSTWNSIPSASGGTCSRNAVIVVRRENQSSIPNGVSDPDPEIPEFPVPVAAAAATAGVGGLLLFRQARMNKTRGVTVS